MSRSRPLSELLVGQTEAYEGFEDAYRALTGEELSPEQRAETLWYEQVRRRLVSLRKASGMTQEQVAALMGTRQSEVSRFEHTLGPGTRLGTLRDYLRAVDVSLEVGGGEAAAAAEEQPLGHGAP